MTDETRSYNEILAENKALRDENVILLQKLAEATQVMSEADRVIRDALQYRHNQPTPQEEGGR